jgi:hypothetical protein
VELWGKLSHASHKIERDEACLIHLSYHDKYLLTKQLNRAIILLKKSAAAGSKTAAPKA